MDLRAYYQKIREIEARIEEAFAIVVSLETGDGGKAGVATEVSRARAAKMVVEGIVRMASEAEAADFLTQKAEAVKVAAEEAAAGQVHLSVVPTNELNQLKEAVRSLRE
jgi:hypothetical protein